MPCSKGKMVSVGVLYTIIGVGFYALLVLTGWAMPEPQSVGRVTDQTLHAFSC